MAAGDRSARRRRLVHYSSRQRAGGTATAVGKVTAGGLARVNVLSTDVVLPADGRTQGLLRVELLDGSSNRLIVPPYLVSFHAVADKGVTQPLVSEQVTSVNGVAESG